MTLCAARLSPNPTNMQQLLLQYAMRSHEMGSEILLAALQSAATSGEEGVENNERVKRMMGVNGMNESEMSMILRERSINSSSYFTNELELRNGSSNSILNNGHFLNEEGNRRPSSVADCKYIDTLLSMPCYLNINALGVFGSSAEVSGSLAALEAVRLYGTVGGGGDEGGEGDEEGGDGGYHRYFVPHDCDGRPVLSGEDSRSKSGNSCGSGFGNNIIDPRSIVCLVLGEGRTPRTAILASQHYCWTTIAIDPTLSEEWDGYHDDAPNFVGYGGSLAEFMDDYDDGTGMIVGRRRNSDLAESMNSTMREYPPRHLVIIAIQPLHSSPAVRLRDNGHINELRARYGDVPTTLVSLRPIPETNWFSPSARMEDGTVGPRRSKLEEDMGYEPNFSYVDEGIFSECRQVEVWNFHNADDDDDDDYYSDEEAYEDGEDGVAEAAGEEKEAMEEERLGPIDTENEEAHTRNASKKTIGEEQAQQRVKSDHHHHVPPAKQSPKKKNEWLEARVAEYKNQQRKAKKYNEEHNESFNTLSTKGTVDTRRVSEVLENPHDIANQCRGHDELDNSSVWSPQDEDALNRVWDKAMSVYDEQQSQSSHQQQDNDNAKRNTHENLPAGWNAFVDPASGDYYYANSETGESTWDLPSCSPNDVVVSCQDEHDRDDASMASKMSELTSEDQPNAAAANNKGADTPPSMQYKPKQNPRLSTILDNDSQSHLDDQSSVSSGIAALNRWNMSDTNLSSHSNDTPGSQERRGSPSLKQQPWHKKDDDEMGNGDSFMFDDYY